MIALIGCDFPILCWLSVNCKIIEFNSLIFALGVSSIENMSWLRFEKYNYRLIQFIDWSSIRILSKFWWGHSDEKERKRKKAIFRKSPDSIKIQARTFRNTIIIYAKKNDPLDSTVMPAINISMFIVLSYPHCQFLLRRSAIHFNKIDRFCIDHCIIAFAISHAIFMYRHRHRIRKIAR